LENEKIVIVNHAYLLASQADILMPVTWGGTCNKPKNVCVGGEHTSMLS